MVKQNSTVHSVDFHRFLTESNKVTQDIRPCLHPNWITWL